MISLKNDKKALLENEGLFVDTADCKETFLTLDRIKIKTSGRNFIEWCGDFGVDVDQYGHKTDYYSSRGDKKIPYLLSIRKHNEDNFVTIEFSSKVLGEEYPLLISKHTIRTCLEKINNLGICSLNIDGIIKDGVVLCMDVTIDIPLSLNSEIINMLDEWSLNRHRHSVSIFNDGISYTAIVKEPHQRCRLTIYDKEVEITKKENKKFLCSIKNANEVIEYFKCKTRFEIRYNSTKKIKSDLGISDTRLTTILNYNGNVILKFYDLIFCNAPCADDYSSLTLKEQERIGFMAYFNFDWDKISAQLKKSVSGNAFYRKHKEYRNAYSQYLATKHDNKDLDKFKSIRDLIASHCPLSVMPKNSKKSIDEKL